MNPKFLRRHEQIERITVHVPNAHRIKVAKELWSDGFNVKSIKPRMFKTAFRVSTKSSVIIAERPIK